MVVDEMPELVSVVLCAHNGGATLDAQLESLAAQDYSGRWELVFVDDASTDGTSAVATAWRERLPMRMISLTQRGGLPNARNVAGGASEGDILLFCDQDDVADPGWITALAAASRHAAAFGGFIEEERLNAPEIRGWRYPFTSGALPKAFGIFPFGVGCNCGVRRSVFDAVGGFSPSYSIGGDEVDFFVRVQLAGYQVAFVPDAIMHIRHRSSLRALARQQYRYGVGTALLYRNFRHCAGLRRTSARETLRLGAKIVRGVPGALASRQKTRSMATDGELYVRSACRQHSRSRLVSRVRDQRTNRRVSRRATRPTIARSGSCQAGEASQKRRARPVRGLSWSRRNAQRVTASGTARPRATAGDRKSVTREVVGCRTNNTYLDMVYICSLFKRQCRVRVVGTIQAVGRAAEPSRAVSR